MEREKILENIRKIVGNKKFTFSDAYIKQCKGVPIIGGEERQYWCVTKKFLYIEECWGVYGYDEKADEYGWKFERYPICYRRGYGQNIKRVELDKMFTKDLQKVLNDLKFYLWWEGCVRFTKVAHEYQECLELKQKYEKMKCDIGYDPRVDDNEEMSVKKNVGNS